MENYHYFYPVSFNFNSRFGNREDLGAGFVGSLWFPWALEGGAGAGRPGTAKERAWVVVVGRRWLFAAVGRNGRLAQVWVGVGLGFGVGARGIPGFLGRTGWSQGRGERFLGLGGAGVPILGRKTG